MSEPTVMIAARNDQIEEYIRDLKVQVVEVNDDIDILCDVLEFQSADFIIVNTLLSFRKIIKLAEKVREIAAKTKIIALVDNPDVKMIAHLAALDVNAFVPLNNLAQIKSCLEHYPASFDFASLAEQKEKRNRLAAPAQIFRPGTIAYGIFSVTAGAGATTFAVALTEQLTLCGCKAVCVSLTNDKAFQMLPKKLRGEYLQDEPGRRDAIMQILYSSNNYQHVIVDFGALFKLDATGKLLNTDRTVLADFLRCNYRIGLAFSDSYHIKKLDFFRDTDLFRQDTARMEFLVSGRGEQNLSYLEDYYRVINRDETSEYINKLLESVGVFVDKGSRSRKGLLSFKRG